jgi:hypothetical protein
MLDANAAARTKDQSESRVGRRWWRTRCADPDVTGHGGVQTANRSAGRELYAIEIASSDGSPTETGGDVTIETRCSSVLTAGPDTVLVVGGEGRR